MCLTVFLLYNLFKIDSQFPDANIKFLSPRKRTASADQVFLRVVCDAEGVDSLRPLLVASPSGEFCSSPHGFPGREARHSAVHVPEAVREIQPPRLVVSCPVHHGTQVMPSQYIGAC